MVNVLLLHQFSGVITMKYPHFVGSTQEIYHFMSLKTVSSRTKLTAPRSVFLKAIFSPGIHMDLRLIFPCYRNQIVVSGLPNNFTLASRLFKDCVQPKVLEFRVSTCKFGKTFQPITMILQPGPMSNHRITKATMANK